MISTKWWKTKIGNSKEGIERLVIARKSEESFIVDLRPLIAAATEAGGTTVEEALLDFLNNETLIEVCVVELRSETCRLGIEAARTLPVFRQEIFEKMEAKKKGER